VLYFSLNLLIYRVCVINTKITCCILNIQKSTQT